MSRTHAVTDVSANRKPPASEITSFVTLGVGETDEGNDAILVSVVFEWPRETADFGLN